MTAAEIVEELKANAGESYKKILLRHGIAEPVLGVKIEHLKKIQKRTKMDHGLAMELYDTGIYDARYLAGLIAEPGKMSKKDLRHWLKTANSAALCGYTVAWVTAESRYAWELGSEWIDSKEELVAVTGWDTLASYVSITDDAQLDLPAIKGLLRGVGKTIHQQPDRVRYTMNSFVIAVGSYVAPLSEAAIDVAESIGTVHVDMGETACKVPAAPAYIRKALVKGPIRKRKSARC